MRGKRWEDITSKGFSNINIINPASAMTTAPTILQRSLMLTYRHVSLYTLKPTKLKSLNKIKNGRALKKTVLY